MAEVEFGILINEIGKAIKEAQNQIDYHSLEVFKSYFFEDEEVDGSITLRPHMVEILMPNLKGGYDKQSVSVASLINHNSLQLEEVRLRMRVTGSLNNKKEKLMVSIEPIQCDLEATDSKDGKHAEIELVFKRSNTPEGIQRVLLKHHKVF